MLRFFLYDALGLIQRQTHAALTDKGSGHFRPFITKRKRRPSI